MFIFGDILSLLASKAAQSGCKPCDSASRCGCSGCNTAAECGCKPCSVNDVAKCGCGS